MQEAKGRTNKQKTKQTQPQNTNKQTTKTKTTATTQLPFAAGETGETDETETTPSKKLVQHCYERQTFFTREDGITLTYREHSRVKGRFRKRPSKPNHKTTQEPKPHQNKPKKNTTKQTKATEPAFHPGVKTQGALALFSHSSDLSQTTQV